MTYNPNVPAATQSLGETQLPIQINFANLNTAFSANHSALTTNTDGKHEFLQMPEQISVPATATDEGGVYTKVTDSVTCLFWRQESNGTEVQMTTSQTPTDANPGTTFLPGGLLMQFGSFTATANTNTTVTFNVAFGTAPYSVVCQMNRNSSNVDTIYAHTLTTIDFRARNTSNSNRTAYYIAIGSAV